MAHQPTGTSADAVASVDDAVAALAVAAQTLDRLLPRLDDAERQQLVTRVGDVVRATDSIAIRIADDLTKRHDGLPKDERFPVTCGYKDPLDMLTSEFSASRRTVRELLAATAALRPTVGLTGDTIPARFPVLGSAVAGGAVSIAQASAIIEALGDSADRALPEHVVAAEHALVASAMGERGTHPAETGVVTHAMPPELLAKVARSWRDALDPDGVEPTYDDLREQRSFTYGIRSDGVVAGRFAFPPDQGAVIVAALDAFTSPRTPVFLDDDERERARLEAQADTRTRGQKMADAIITIVRGAVETGNVPRIGKEAPTVVTHVALSALQAYAAGATGRTATDERTGAQMPIHLAAAMMCDAIIEVVVTDAKGQPLQLGRKQRFFNRAQRRALAARDGGCRAPGCTAPVGWSDAHHIHPWSLGGTTDIENGILLCPHHHHEVHRGNLEIIKGPGGWVVVPKTRQSRRRRGWAEHLEPATLYLQPLAA